MTVVAQWLELASPAPDETLRTAIETAIELELRSATPAADVLADTARRRVVRADVASGCVVLKRVSAAAPFRDVLRRPVLGTPVRREWRASTSAAAVLRDVPGAPLVPAPIACVAAAGTEFLVTEEIAGIPFLDVYTASPSRERRQWIDRLGVALRSLATARLAHGDLHLGNILVCGDRLAFLDWKESRLRARASALARDLADLEFSLARSGVQRAGRLRLRKASLGSPGSAVSRTALRGAAARADAAAQDHYRGRTRRALVVGRRFAAVDPAIGRGMRVAEISNDSVARALEAHKGTALVLKDDERSRVTRIPSGGDAGTSASSWIVKEVTKRGFARRLADPFRGSPAQRGWLGGHGLLARGVHAARPLAFVELAERRSLLILEDASPRPCLEDAEAAQWKSLPESALADALLALLLSLHRRGVDHGDLQSSHLFGDFEDRRLRAFALIDLEGVRFKTHLSDDARLRALSELNASLGEAHLANDTRRRIFDCYARALPFEMPRKEALRAVVRRSNARNHRWSTAER